MQRKITIYYVPQLPMRSLSELQRAAIGFKSRVRIQRGASVADAKSPTEMVIFLKAKGKNLEITAEGEDASTAVDSLRDVVMRETAV